MSNPIYIDIKLEKRPEGWVGYVEGSKMTNPESTPHEALRYIAHLMEIIYNTTDKFKERS